MSDNQDRVDTFDKNKAAEVLLSGGGMAIWSSADEVAPRAVIRQGGDFVHDVTHIAALQVGLERLTEGCAKVHGMKPQQLRRAVTLAAATLREKMDGAIRITKAKKGDQS